MQLRNPAESRTSRGAITWTAVMVGLLCLLSATNASAALSGTLQRYSVSTTGSTRVSDGSNRRALHGWGIGPWLLCRSAECVW